VINQAVVRELCTELTSRAGGTTPFRRIPIRVWALSGVERLCFADGRTAVFKYATEPFTDEHLVLQYTARRGVPVPEVYASVLRDGVLGIVMEDLGEPVRWPNDTDGAAAAAATHAAGSMPGLRLLSEAALGELPQRALALLRHLRAAGRFADDTLVALLSALARAAPMLAAGAELPPFGLCHGELHPTSVHLGRTGAHVLDLAKAHNGPGLLDLATWQGTRRAVTGCAR
jgi:hypothetical protein